MDPELLKLTKEVLEKGLTCGLWVALFGGFVAAGVGACAGAYLKKIGELRALDERFDRVLEQLQTQTTATEGIKADFAKDIAAFAENAKAESSKVLELLRHQLSQQDEDRTRRIEMRLRALIMASATPVDDVPGRHA